MNKTDLRNYARLIVRVGANVQKGQDVEIFAGVNDEYFVKYVVEEAYKAKARKVTVNWSSDEVDKIVYSKTKVNALKEVPEWFVKRWEHRRDTLPCMIHIVSEDPDALAGVDQNKMMEVRRAQGPLIRPIRKQMENKYQWCIASVPGEKWAKKVFPNLTKKKAVERLWEEILKCSRAYDNDPIKNWDMHNLDLKNWYEYLNSLKLKELIYESSNGTNLKVGLIEDALFLGGAEKSLKGKVFNPNIPSEEIFTSPKKGECEGVVYSTKPLSYRGEVIEDFSISFKDGKVVSVKAKKNEELLKKMVNEDEGASYLGECALVPFDSPINNSGLLFYNTLFDENACCHLALGHGFTNVIKDYEKYSLEELRNKGVNDSMIHVDFMIGSSDLSIKGVDENGNIHQIFINGNWAF